MGAYHGNVLEAVDSVIESDIVAVALLSFLEAHNNEFAGRTKDLLAKIGIFADEGAKRERSWPRNPQSLSNRLRLATPALRKCGVTIERRKSNGRRLIVITRTTKG